MGNFLITGYPRSRTAWLAALCNTLSNTICYHEPIAQGFSWREVWSKDSPKNIGISDPGIGPWLSHIIQEFHPKILLIKRNKDDAEASLDKLGFGGTGICDQLETMFYPLLCYDNFMQVSFEQLRDSKHVSTCLKFLVPDSRLTLDKIEQFQRFNIQVRPEQTLEEVLRA